MSALAAERRPTTLPPSATTSPSHPTAESFDACGGLPFLFVILCLYRAGSAPPETAASDHTAHHRCRNHRSLRRAGGANHWLATARSSMLQGRGRYRQLHLDRSLCTRPPLGWRIVSAPVVPARSTERRPVIAHTRNIFFFHAGGLSSGCRFRRQCRRPPDTAWRHAEVSWARCASDTVISLMGQNWQLPELREMRQATVFYVFGL